MTPPLGQFVNLNARAACVYHLSPFSFYFAGALPGGRGARLETDGALRHLSALNASIHMVSFFIFPSFSLPQARSLEDAVRTLVVDSSSALKVARAADAGVAVLKRCVTERASEGRFGPPLEAAWIRKLASRWDVLCGRRGRVTLPYTSPTLLFPPFLLFLHTAVRHDSPSPTGWM